MRPAGASNLALALVSGTWAMRYAKDVREFLFVMTAMTQYNPVNLATNSIHEGGSPLPSRWDGRSSGAR